jgi:hypothetical protein
VNEPDRHCVQKVELLAPSPLGDHQARLLELLEVLHHAEASHWQAGLERAQRLPILPEELIEQAAPSWIGKGSEYRVHALDNR